MARWFKVKNRKSFKSHKISAHKLKTVGKERRGIFRGTPKGYGFVELDDGTEVFIPKPRTAGAIHGDIVFVQEIIPKPHFRVKKTVGREALVIKIVERKNEVIVGRFERHGQYGVVSPIDEKFGFKIIVPTDESLDAKTNEVVRVKLKPETSKIGPLHGQIVEVLGEIEDAKVLKSLVLSRFGLSDRFPKAVNQEAEAISSSIPPKEIKKRSDLRELPFVTIDGEHARDFDDAIALKYIKDDIFRVYVAIADVSYFVPSRSAIDKEALIRGTSVYFPDFFIPMLPLHLTTEVCSLKAGVDRLTLIVSANVSKDGLVFDSEIYEGVIKNKKRLTYNLVQELLDAPGSHKGYKPFVPMLKTMADLSGSLRKRRITEGSIEFELPEEELELGAEGKVISIKKTPRLVSHEIIEEFMLMANRIIAEKMREAIKHFIYRVHEPPEGDQIEAFLQMAINLGHLLIKKRSITSKDFNNLLEVVKGEPTERAVNYIVLRLMKQARYDTRSLGHFGLAFPYYTHFTSPIRRYPDLVVHRLVKAGLKLSRPRKLHSGKELSSIAEKSSDMERNAVDAERWYMGFQKAFFMRGHIGKKFSGTISRLFKKGFFVELDDFYIDGFVPKLTLPFDNYFLTQDELHLVGRKTKRTYTLGDKVKIRVDSSDPFTQRIDFSLVL